MPGIQFKITDENDNELPWDGVAFVDKIPHTAMGKLGKLKLRGSFTDFQFPDTAAG